MTDIVQPPSSSDIRPLKGRCRIETSVTEVDAGNLLEVLSKAEPKFRKIQREVRYLHNYFLGDQPILHRSKDIRDEICNKPVENHAQEITNFYTGYVFGHPCVYVRSGGGEAGSSDEIQELNNHMMYQGKDCGDRVLGQWLVETGLGYRLILPGSALGDPVNPFVLDVLAPDTAYVVRSSGIGHQPMMAVIHIPQDDGDTIRAIYTKNTYFEVVADQIVKMEPHYLGGIPVIEYELNPERMGAFEPVLDLLDELNNMAANRYDGVEQQIQSLLKFVNCEIDEPNFEKMKERGAIAIKSSPGLPADVDVVSTDLDQTQTQVLVDYTLDQLCAISGLPSTQGSEASTSDNVGAVIIRNGWNQTEARAQQIETMFKESEKRFLRIALSILSMAGELDLNVTDIDIRFPRRQYENLQSKATVFTMLLSQPINPEIAFKYPGLFPDPQAEFESSRPYLAAAGKLLEGGSLSDAVLAPEEDAEVNTKSAVEQ